MTEADWPDDLPAVDEAGRAYLRCGACGLPVYSDPEADTDSAERCGCDAADRAGYRFLPKAQAVEHIEAYLQ